jgi:exodeoxyribonuclease VII large subunit
MRVLTVSQVATYLRELIESNLALNDLWISGEVSNRSRPGTGHTYFSLKDHVAQLEAVFFAPPDQRRRQMVQHLENGSQVIVHGRITFYEQRGRLQIVADFVEPEGLGLRQAQFNRLRLQLEEEGLFDVARKRRLPPFPRRVGVVTSPTGAVFHDICNILARRWPLTEVLLAPTPVQGPDAIVGVVAALSRLNARNDVDAIILARGGGSSEELWTFNEEPVARAVFASVVPVISAVGHETDTTLCDYVADVRAPTPSAAAELVAPDRLQLGRQIENRLAHALGYLQQTAARDRRAVENALARSERAVPEPARLRQRIADFDRRALASMTAGARSLGEQLGGCQRQMVALDPKATLKRGYAVVHKGDHVVSSVAAVETGDSLVIRVGDGGFPARVDAPTRRRRRKAPRVAATLNGNGVHPENGDAPRMETGKGVQPALFV